MTRGEACALVVDLIRQCSAAREEARAWRLVALKAIADEAERMRTHEMITGRLMRRYEEAARQESMRRRQEDAAA